MSRRRLAVWTGQAAALLFGLMWVVLQWQVRPEAGGLALPQSSFASYSDAHLWNLGQALGPEVLATYRAVLVWLDTAFILCFAAFVALAVWPRRWLLPLPLAYALVDLTENRLILAGLERPVTLPIHQAAAYPFTLLKFALFALCCGALLWVWWQNRVSQAGNRG